MADKPVEKAEKTSALPRSPDLMNAEDSALLVVDAQVKLLEIIPQRARIVWNIRRLLDTDAGIAKINLPGDQHARRRAGKLFIE